MSSGSSRFVHGRHSTEAFGPPASPLLERDEYEPEPQSIPILPAKIYLVLIRGPKPGIYFDYGFVVNSYLRKLQETLHLMSYTTHSKSEARLVYAQAKQAGLVADDTTLRV